MASSSLGSLPAELILQILSYLHDDDIAAVQSTSRELRTACRDDNFWRARCFGESRLASTLRRKNWRQNPAHPQSNKARRIEIRAAWNAVFDNGEPVSWYDEHIQRNGKIATNWFELPRRHDGRRLLDNAGVLEVCGVALYRPQGANEGVDASNKDESDDDDDNDNDEDDKLEGIPSLLAVAPLEDGSVCLWDVNGTVKRRGAIVKQSAPGVLFSGFQNPENEKPVFSATECVAVDSPRSLAYFAIQDRLVAVDLRTLSVVGVENFPQKITALSSAHPSVPLSVGTGAGIYLHDSRARTEDAASTPGFRSVDKIADGLYTAPFPQPGPLSIVHIQEQGLEDTVSNDILAAGRISSILHYDRRKLSVAKNAIHSGASLCGLTSIPYPFPAIEDYSHLNKGKIGTDGRTVVACGEYKSKGSLELYPIDEGQPNKHMVNRQTSSSAKIFSVASHGTRLAVSDGVGFVRWFERDGFTEVRRYALGSDDYEEDIDEEAGTAQTAAVPRMAPRHANNATESGDIARKLLPIHPGSASSSRKRDNSFRNNGLLFWTGDKLGLISFMREKGTRSSDFIEDTKTAAERATEEEGKAYRTKMRQLFKSARAFGEDSDSDD